MRLVIRRASIAGDLSVVQWGADSDDRADRQSAVGRGGQEAQGAAQAPPNQVELCFTRIDEYPLDGLRNDVGEECFQTQMPVCPADLTVVDDIGRTALLEQVRHQ